MQPDVNTAQRPQFPIRLDRVFFTSFEFRRDPQIPESLQLEFSIQVKVHSERLPGKLQIDLKVETAGDLPIVFSAQLLGLFSAIEGEPGLDPNDLPDFVNERALHMLWPYIAQIVRMITGQMGTGPIDLPIPHTFNLQPSEQATEDSTIDM